MISKLDNFLQVVRRPLVIVSTLPRPAKETVVKFLLNLNAPVYLEGISGLREDPRLKHLRLINAQNIRRIPIDGVLRVGGVPTLRYWRDLESMEGSLQVLSLSHLPWRGLSWGAVEHNSEYHCLLNSTYSYDRPWFSEDPSYQNELDLLIEAFPNSEPAIVRRLSQAIPSRSLIYLGNSLPIREWDLAAVDDFREWNVYASRGMNGIDGQLSTFFGMCRPGCSNWCILGDLTTLYDMAAPWIMGQLGELEVHIVVINNGGGMIFSGMSDRDSLLNRHQLTFEHFAKLWDLPYQKTNDIIQPFSQSRLIELVPCPDETAGFWSAYSSV